MKPCPACGSPELFCGLRCTEIAAALDHMEDLLEHRKGVAPAVAAACLAVAAGELRGEHLEALAGPPELFESFVDLVATYTLGVRGGHWPPEYER